jgi:hypothetical protein
MTEFDARVIAARDGDLEAYAWAVHNRPVEPYQLWWADFLDTENHAALICPPDTFKSTTVQWTVEQDIGRDPEGSTLWLMNAKDQSEKRIDSIAQTIEHNAVWCAAFPNVRPDPSRGWNKSELYVTRRGVRPDPTLMGTGFLGAYQGFHFKRGVIDDPSDQDDVRSPAIMNAQRDRLRGVLKDRIESGGFINAIFTRWGETDLLPTFLDMGFSAIQMPILADYPWGPSLSPTRFPPERIEELRVMSGESMFNLTYMCDTSALSGSLIQRGHLRYWDSAMIPDVSMPLFMAVDPAASEKTSADRRAIATVGYDYKTRRLFLLDLWQGRPAVPDFRKEIRRRYHDTAGVVAIGVETIAFQLSLMQDLKREDSLPLTELPYRSRRTVQSKALGVDRDKTSRALYLDSLFTSGRLYLPHGLPTWDGVSLETELLNYGRVDNRHHDDGPDVIAFACALAEATVARGGSVNMQGF